MGLRKRIWSAAHRAYATSQRQLPWCAPRDRGHDAGVHITSAYRLTAQEKHVLGSAQSGAEGPNGSVEFTRLRRIGPIQ